MTRMRGRSAIRVGRKQLRDYPSVSLNVKYYYRLYCIMKRGRNGHGIPCWDAPEAPPSAPEIPSAAARYTAARRLQEWDTPAPPARSHPPPPTSLPTACSPERIAAA